MLLTVNVEVKPALKAQITNAPEINIYGLYRWLLLLFWEWKWVANICLDLKQIRVVLFFTCEANGKNKYPTWKAFTFNRYSKGKHSTIYSGEGSRYRYCVLGSKSPKKQGWIFYENSHIFRNIIMYWLLLIELIINTSLPYK